MMSEGIKIGAAVFYSKHVVMVVTIQSPLFEIGIFPEKTQ